MIHAYIFLHLQHMATKYEMHIALPVTTNEKMQAAMTALARAGIEKTKYFLAVKNIAVERTCADVPPTGHDLEHPGAMATAKTETRQEAVELILKGMKVLKDLDLDGNFELEGVIAPAISEYDVIPVNIEFPGFVNVPDSPGYENHLVFKNAYAKLPSFDEIIEMVRVHYDLPVHQIVDFARVSAAGPEDMVSRVATIYQPNREAALNTAKKLRDINKKNIVGFHYDVAEQVMAVGKEE